MSSTSTLTRYIKEDVPCVFAKYGDGEYQCANFWNGGNCDGVIVVIKEGVFDGPEG